MLPPLHLERGPRGHGQAHVKLYAPPPGDPRCQILLQGAMSAVWADWLARVIRLGAFALRHPFTESGRSRRVDD